MSYLSRVQYTGAGNTALYSIPFAYISKAYIEVRVGGSLLTEGVGFTWQSATSILLAAGNLPAGVVLDIRRVTPNTAKLVDFQDGSVLTESSLDLANDQVFQLVQEAQDDMQARIAVQPDGTVDGQNRRIKNVAGPINPNDVVTKAYGDVAYGWSSVITSTAKAVEAAASASSAETARAEAVAAKDTAVNAAASATNYPVASPTHAATGKATPGDADELPLIDSAASWGIKKLTWANLKGGIWESLGPLIATGTGKATPVDADYITIADSSAANSTKSLSWANIKATLKTYFDTLYAAKITTVSMVRLNTANGYGSTNTVIKRYSTVVTNQGSDITYTDSATLGGSFTINTSGVYSMHIFGTCGGAFNLGISINSAQLTTSVDNISTGDKLAEVGGSNTTVCASWTGYVAAGAVIRPHCGPYSPVSAREGFTIARVS